MSGSLSNIGEDLFPDIVDKKVPILLVLDTSGSMHGEAINQLNRGLQLFQDAFDRTKGADLEVIRAGEIGIVTFGNGGVQVFDLVTGRPGASGSGVMVPARTFRAPTLTAGGETPMGEAMRRTLAIIRYQKDEWRAMGQPYYRPMVFLISDGEPTDAGWESAAAECRKSVEDKGCIVMPIAVERGNKEKLGRFSTMPVLPLANVAKFQEFFKFLSDSMGTLAHNKGSDAGQIFTEDKLKAWAQQSVD